MNPRELDLHRALEKAGFEVYRNGWPDFFVVDRLRRRAAGVELKSVNDLLSFPQIQMHKAMQLIGLPTCTVYGHGKRSVEEVQRAILFPRESLLDRARAVEHCFPGGAQA